MLVHRGKQGINKKNKTKNNPKQMRLWQTPGVIYQSQNTEPREVTNGWSTGVCTPLHRSLLFKRRGGISRAERGPFLGSFLLSGRREGSAFGQNRPKRLQSGSLEQRPEPPEWPHVSAASVGQWGAELPSTAGWHAHTLHRHASSDAQEGGRANHVLEKAPPHLPGCCVSTSLRQSASTDRR